MRSNAADRSASRTHWRLDRRPLSVQKIASIASWQPRPGRNPYERGSNRASHSGSSALATRACCTRSRSTGIPSGRCFPPAFGMYTRLTGRACHGAVRRWISPANEALAGEVNATCPSMPAVLRPALRCVTRRTLTSVFDRLRSISFCRLRTRFRSTCSGSPGSAWRTSALPVSSASALAQRSTVTHWPLPLTQRRQPAPTPHRRPGPSITSSCNNTYTHADATTDRASLCGRSAPGHSPRMARLIESGEGRYTAAISTRRGVRRPSRPTGRSAHDRTVGGR